MSREEREREKHVLVKSNQTGIKSFVFIPITIALMSILTLILSTLSTINIQCRLNYLLTQKQRVQPLQAQL